MLIDTTTFNGAIKSNKHIVHTFFVNDFKHVSQEFNIQINPRVILG